MTRDFLSLARACAGRPETPDQVRRLMAEGLLPRPTYVLPDGTEMVPPNYFDLADAAGGPGLLPAWFARRLGEELAARGMDASRSRVDEDREAYLAGEYGACLVRVSPENIAEKARLIEAVERAIARPEPADPAWSRSLRREVDRLDAMVRPFAAWDRLRFGRPTSRDRLIAAVRAEVAELRGSGADDAG